MEDTAEIIDSAPPPRNQNIVRTRAVAVTASIVAATLAVLLIAFATRLNNVTSDRDRLERALGASATELDSTQSSVFELTDQLEAARAEAAQLGADGADAVEQLNQMTDLVDEQNGVIEDQAVTIEDQAATIETLASRADALESSAEDWMVTADDEAEARAKAEEQLAFYGAPDDPNLAPVVIDGRWDITWSDQPLACTGFDATIDCAREKVLRLISISEAQTRTVRVKGGPLPLNNLEYSMTGTEKSSYSCNGQANVTTHTLTFRITGGDLVGGVIVATRVVGELVVSATSEACNDGLIRWSFTATRTG